MLQRNWVRLVIGSGSVEHKGVMFVQRRTKSWGFFSPRLLIESRKDVMSLLAQVFQPWRRPGLTRKAAGAFCRATRADGQKTQTGFL